MWWKAGTFHHTGDGKVNWGNIFGGQFESTYQKGKGTDLVLGISTIGGFKYAKIYMYKDIHFSVLYHTRPEHNVNVY